MIYENFTFLFTDLHRTLLLLSRALRIRTALVFVFIVVQSLFELAFILALAHMGLALTDGDSLRSNLLYQTIFYILPDVKAWSTDPKHLLLLAGIVLIFVCLIKNLINYVAARSIALLGEDISLFIGTDIMERFLYRDYAWHLSSQSATFFQRMLWRGNMGIMLTHLLTLYANVATLIILMLSLVSHEPALTTLVVTITGTVGIILYRSIRCHVDANAILMTESSQKETQALLCATKGIREVLIYRQQPVFLQALAQAATHGQKPRTFMSIAPSLPTWALEATGFAVVMAAIVHLIYMQNADVKRITAALALLLLTAWRVLPYCNRVVSLLISIRSLRPMTTAVLELLESLHDVPALHPPTPSKDFTFTQDITLNKVCFRYAEADFESLSDISFCIRKGEKVGIIGPSGSGKSTLAGILSGLLPPTNGHITVDGQELSPENAAAFATMIGYVPQTPFLFAGTLAENIAFSQWGRTWEENRVRDACKQASIDFVNTHPLGLNQPIGENGAGLSGGQAQRVSIARAMYTQPSLLIFDEATSSLDQANENAIQSTIDSLAHKTTCIIIAHRLATVEHCDTLVWMDKGRIVMQGDPKTILSAYMLSPFNRESCEHPDL